MMGGSTSTPIDLHPASVSQRGATVSLPRSSPLSFDWSVDLALPAGESAVGLSYGPSRGLILATSTGHWIVISGAEHGIGPATSSSQVEIADGSRPVAIATMFGDEVQSIQADRTAIAEYDFRTCGLRAKAQPSLRLADGAKATVIGTVSPNLGGFASNRWLLIAGNVDGKPGQLAGGPVTEAPAKSFGAPFVSVPETRTLDFIAGFDIAGGCDAIAGFVDGKGRTVVRTFCSPQFADDTTLLAGDVGLPVRRKPIGDRKSVTLGTVGGKILGASEGWVHDRKATMLVLTAPTPGVARIIVLSAAEAEYNIQRR
jgi:hypothetical protein